MDALMAALVVAALAGIGDKPAWLAAILADRYRAPALVIVAGIAAFATVYAAAAVAGALLGPMLAPSARLLVLAMALALQGGGALFAPGEPDRLAGWRLGAVATGYLGLLILAFGEGVAFVTAALAARSAVPALAAVGATIGAAVPLAAAATLGEARWRALPLGVVRIAVSAVLLVLAAAVALAALGLV